MLKKRWIVASYLVLAIGLTACSSGDVSDDTTTQQDVQTDNNENGDGNDENDSDGFNDGDLEKYKEIKLTAADAYNAFLEKKPGSKVQKIGLDYEHNRYSYKVEGSDQEKKYDIELDAQNSEILRLEQDDKDDEIKEITLDDVDKIDAIVKKVLDQEKSGFASIEWELYIEKDVHTLELEVEKSGNSVEYMYDLNTGELLEKDK